MCYQAGTNDVIKDLIWVYLGSKDARPSQRFSPGRRAKGAIIGACPIADTGFCKEI